MAVIRVLLASSTLLAVVLVPTQPAAASDNLTWAQVQAAAHAAQSGITQGGGTATVEVTAKISFRQVTDYRPGGSANRERYREAGMSDSEPDRLTWTITRNGAVSRYRPMPPLPKAGRYPTLRTATWVRLNPPTAGGVTPPILQLNVFDPLGEMSSSPADEAGITSASWIHGVEGEPVSDVNATFAQQPTGVLVLRSFSVRDLHPTGPGSALSVQVGFANPQLVVPRFSSALPEDYVAAALDAARDTAFAFYAVRNAANSAREKADQMTRTELIAYVRRQVAANEDFAHPPADPTTDTIANLPRGLRLTNPNAYSGRSTIWTISVTPDNRVVLTRRTKPSTVTPAP